MKKLFFILALILGASVGWCSPVTPEEAIMRLNRAGRVGARSIIQVQELKYTACIESGTPVAYVFSSETAEGFTILSADTRALPMLGYSDKGIFDPDNIPEGLNWLLESYGDQLSQATKLDIPDYQAGTISDYPAISPMIKTKWDQLNPYNLQCPAINGQLPPTGCVATSLAQTMNYFKYPESGVGTISYAWGSKRLRLLLDNKIFAWNQMLDSYVEGKYTEEQAAAVSFLMQAAGYGVQMDYGVDQSGAYSERIVEAVTKYFKYDPNTWYATRNYYSQSEWYRMIYENLRDCGPVIYNGTSPLTGGHSFICDGYDGNGYFHINWGWSGVSDGYFSLDLLGPNVQGTGGGLGNFSFSQDAVLGMRPSDGGEAKPKYANLQQCGASVGSISGNNILMLSTTDGSPRGWYNPTSTQKISVELGIEIEKIDGSGTQYVSAIIKSLQDGGDATGAITIDPGYYISSENYNLSVELPNLPSGEYRITVVTRDSKVNNAPWQPILIPYGYANYVYLVAIDGKYEVKNVAPAELLVKEIKMLSPLYKGKNAKFSIQFENPNEVEVTVCVTPGLFRKGTKMYQAFSKLISLRPHSSLDYEWITNFYMLKGADSFFAGQEFTLELINQDNMLIMGKSEEIPMEATPPNLLVLMDKLSIEGVQSSTVTIDGTDYSRVYMIPDYSDFKIDFAYTIKKGYFDTTMTLGIYEKDPDTGTMNKIREVYSNSEFLDTGMEKKVLVKAAFPEADINKIYYLRAEYIYEGVPLYIGQIQLAFATSGLNELTYEESQEPEYFTLQGIRIQSPAKGQLIIEKRGGKATKKIWR